MGAKRATWDLLQTFLRFYSVRFLFNQIHDSSLYTLNQLFLL